MPKLNGNDLMAFKAISSFIKDIGEEYNIQQKSLALYMRLIEKTTLFNEESIHKHLNIFKEFCKLNKDAINNKDKDKIKSTTITYSSRVFININHILKISSSENEDIIWQHLLTISAILNPSSGAKKKLENYKKEENQNEDNFLKNIVEKVEDNINPDSANPTDAIKNVMESGILTDLMGSMTSGMENGNLDLGKLMGSLQNMMGNIDNNSLPPELSQMTTNLQNMMGNLTK